MPLDRSFKKSFPFRRRLAPTFRSGLRDEHVADIAVIAANASSMKANPITFTPDELAQILLFAL